MSFRRAQARSASLLEAAANVLVGYLVALATQSIVLPLFGIRSSLADNLQIAAAFTVVSLLRSYLLRRLFERVAWERGLRRTRPADRAWRMAGAP